MRLALFVLVCIIAPWYVISPVGLWLFVDWLLCEVLK